MARRKRGAGRGGGAARGGGATGRKSKTAAPVTPVIPQETTASPSESEESSGSGIISVPSQTSTAIHKKFGKFRCLHLDDSVKSEVSGSDSDLPIEVVGIVDPNQSSESEVGGNDKMEDPTRSYTPIAEEICSNIVIEEDVATDSLTSVEHANLEESLRKITMSENEEECVENGYASSMDNVEVCAFKQVNTLEEYEKGSPSPMQEENVPSPCNLLEETHKSEDGPSVDTLEPVDMLYEEDSISESVQEPVSDKNILVGLDSPCSESLISSNDTTNDSVGSAEGLMAKGGNGGAAAAESTDSPTENVRRSSRIRNISELKMKSRGRGLVQTKAMLKQGYGDVSMPCVPPPPVKVKQRWRRSSELEAAKEDPEMEHRLRQFNHLKENLYLTERLTSKEAKKMTCDCFLTKEEIDRGEFGCGEDCLNRLLMIECGNYCVVGERCTNKRFQNQKYATCEVFRTEKKGFGIRAVKDIPGGEFIMEYVGEVVNQSEFEKRAEIYSEDKNIHYYFMSLRADAVIDATQKGNVSRFINHSCDPNAETQKWTVHGELRIGFFARRDIPAHEEITFDYQFQRYGKEAQKCYCEAPLCRGWIGEEPEDDEYEEDVEEEDDQEDIKKIETDSQIETSEDVKQISVDKESPGKVAVRRPREYRKKPKRADIRDDADLEVEIDKLSASGIKNRAHTLTLSRLLVRACDAGNKAPRLLKLLRNADLPCRRLFLDYHGLRLLHTWMIHDADNAFKVEILETLAALPIPNKTMLQDSKVLSTVQKWSIGNETVSPNTDSGNSTPEVVSVPKQEPEPQMTAQTELMCLALKLLTEWATLKEVFRIPKKERIEQMKEHEREADRAMLNKEAEVEAARDRYERYRMRGKGRESPPRKVTSAIPVIPPRLTKHQRRHMFAMQVAQEEEERRRNQQAEAWRNHEQRCLALGIDPRQPFIPTPTVWFQTPPPLPPPPPPPPPVKLPPKWKCVKDNRGRPYYYHIKIRISQWEPPEFPEPAPIVVDTPTTVDGDSSTSSSEESSSVSDTSSSDEDSSDDDLELDDTRLMLEVRQKLRLANPDVTAALAIVKDSPKSLPAPKRKREALVQEIIISPRREEDKLMSKLEAKKYRETKEKLRKRKEMARAKEKEIEKEKEKEKRAILAEKDKDVGTGKEHKIKMHFRKKMANIMVHILGPYKKSECRIGRITNTEDFKHLAKKLTMFVMLKELKNCRTVGELTVNESVKGKAREFVKKYMSKYGETYTRSTDID